MFPLDTVLVTRDEGILADLRRELARNDALILAEFPDVSTTLLSRDLPEGQRWLFLTYVKGPEDLRQLQKLVQAYPTHPVAALVDEDCQLVPLGKGTPGLADAGASSVSRANMFIRAMRAGAMQVVTLPLDPDDFRCALESIAARFAPAAESTVIAVSGAQGGCGATTVALNLADALSQSRKCILAELTPHLGMLASYLDFKPDYTLDDLLGRRRLDPQLVKTALVQATPGLAVLCGPYREVVPQASVLSEAEQTSILVSIVDHLRRLAPVVVIEVPPTHDARYFELLHKADRIVFVVGQSLPSIHSLQLIEKALLPAEHQTHGVVVNRFDCRGKGLTLPQVEGLLKTQDLWKVSADAALTLAANEGRPLRQAAPHAPAVAEFEAIARALVKEPPKQAAGFWNWLTGRSAPQTMSEGGRL